MKRITRLSLKNKIFFFLLAAISLFSIGMALVTRWVLVSNMNSSFEQRGIDLAQAVGTFSRAHILTKNVTALSSLLNAAREGDLKIAVENIFITDTEGGVLVHTFQDSFPRELLLANRNPQKESSVKLQLGEDSVRDIASPVKAGNSWIGTIHVVLNNKILDDLVDKSLITLWGALFALAFVFIGISRYISGNITRPMSQLSRTSDEISRGNLDFQLEMGSEARCWEIKECGEVNCPAYEKTDRPCWYVDQTLVCGGGLSGEFPEKVNVCKGCDVYQEYAGDEFVQFSDSLRNMTIRLKASEAGLRESEQKYRSLFDSGPNPIFVLDRARLEILDANLTAERTYGYSREELIGKGFKELGPFDHRFTESEYLENQNYPEAPIISQKVRHYKKGEKPFYVNVHSRLTTYGNKEAIIVATTDITEMMEKDAQLIQAGKMTSLGEMSAGIAHELNQPLNAIKIGNDFLKKMIKEEKEIPEDDLNEVVNEVNNQVDRAAAIINRLREFGRKSDFTRDKIDINNPVRSVLDIIGQQLALQNIKLLVDLDENLPSIMAHNNRLEQVIFNLMTNARDAINMKKSAENHSSERVITVRSFREADRVAITVRDTGTGIPEEIKNDIFEPFFTTKETGSGMGLGLSIAYGIVKDYKGDIQIDGKEGDGTTFKLTFPYAAD